MNNDEMIAHVKAQLRLAETFQAEGKKPQMIAVLRGLLPLQAEGTFWGNVAHLLSQAADLDGAEAAARRFVASCPDVPQARSLLAGILGETGKSDEALRLAEGVAVKLAHMPAAHYSLGVQQARINRLEDARDSFKKALDCDPDDALAMEYLAYLGNAETCDETLTIVDDAIARGVHAGQPNEAALHYARATLLERQQRWADAFEAFQKGARLMRAAVRIDLDGMERYAGRLRESFSAPFFSEASSLRHPNARPVFIVGMPRSGTTLVESVLAAHSRVTAGGETTLLSVATMSFGSFEPPDLERISRKIAAGENPWVDMGQALEKLHDTRFGTRGRVTEKNLGHHFLLGVIAMIAAGAPIIYCKREPVATAWSCFKTRFQRGNAWSYAFDTIARYQRLYANLMAHWQSALPAGSILEVDYEALVAEPNAVIPGMLSHAGLDTEPACLSPHRSERPVLTASLAQVREPIHTGAISAWQRYETWLGPYLDDLRAV